MKEEIRNLLLNSGAVAVGFSKAGDTDESEQQYLSRWIGEGYHGDMTYLERHQALRNSTDSVLKGAKTVISLAYSYFPAERREESLPEIAPYAYGEDYHVVLRDLLQPLIKTLKYKYGGKWRVCIDSAPISERYWAVKSGIGKRGLNGAVIIKDAGSYCFLVEILTTLEISPDESSSERCKECGECMNVCPGKAIRPDGVIIASKCINYLTIEKKDEFSEEERDLIREGAGYLFGCDRCLRVCPHNQSIDKELNKFFVPIPQVKVLTAEEIISMDELKFKNVFSLSPLLYAGYTRLIRNAETLKKSDN